MATNHPFSSSSEKEGDGIILTQPIDLAAMVGCDDLSRLHVRINRVVVRCLDGTRHECRLDNPDGSVTFLALTTPEEDS